MFFYRNYISEDDLSLQLSKLKVLNDSSKNYGTEASAAMKLPLRRIPFIV